MTYVVVGAGAVGGAIACLLDEAGREVVVVARGAHGEAIGARGLTLRRPSGTETRRIRRVAAADEVELGDGDVVLLGVKSQDVPGALATIPRGAAIVCAQNGVVAEALAAERSERVYGMMSWIPAQHLEPGVVELFDSRAPGVFRVGRYPDGIDGVAERVAADLAAAGFDARAVADVMRWKHGKLLANLGNVIDAYFERDEAVEPFEKQARAEGEAALRAAGIEFVPVRELYEGMLERSGWPAKIDGVGRGGGSTWQSVSRGMPTEVGQLNGWICELGERVDVATPVNRALVELAAEATGPRSVSVDRLRARVTRRAGPTG